MKLRKLFAGVWNIILFVVVWIPFYNESLGAQRPINSIIFAGLAFTILYLLAVVKVKNNEILPQLATVVLLDVLMYVECSLIGHHWNNFLPMFEAMVGQVCGAALILIVADQYLSKDKKVQKTFLVRGKDVSDDTAKAFAKRLLARKNNYFKFTSLGSEDLDPRTLIQQIKANETIILYKISPELRGDFLKICSELKKDYYFTSSIEDMISQGASYRQLGDSMLLQYKYRNEVESEYSTKRCLDMLFSALLMIVLSPLIFILAAAVQIEDKGIIINRQSCCKKDGKEFVRYTFRVNSLEEGKQNSLTKTGKFLQRTGMYALPQLLNVFKGDMSFVGPKPESVELTKKNTKALSEYSYRNWCAPGITGYAQLYSSPSTPAIDKLNMDIMYVENNTVSMDLKIIVLSLLKIAIKQPI